MLNNTVKCHEGHCNLCMKHRRNIVCNIKAFILISNSLSFYCVFSFMVVVGISGVLSGDLPQCLQQSHVII